MSLVLLCTNGHQLDETNLRTRADGRQYCKLCHKNQMRKRRRALGLSTDGPRRNYPRSGLVYCQRCNRIFPRKLGVHFETSSFCIHSILERNEPSANVSIKQLVAVGQ